MEFMDNDFNISNANAHFFYHHQQQVDPFHMPYNEAPLTLQGSSHDHLVAASYHPSLTAPSLELCHNQPDKSGGGRKRKRRRGERAVEGLKPSDVVHVRAKRGQATDSHSLAERVRRRKINEKLQGLHDIVPGCHKTMGMAVMLDVVIKYIQSLQNQIEFLSMNLLTASLFNDLNSPDMDNPVDTIQGSAPDGAGVREMEWFAAEGYGSGGAPNFNSA